MVTQAYRDITDIFRVSGIFADYWILDDPARPYCTLSGLSVCTLHLRQIPLADSSFQEKKKASRSCPDGLNVGSGLNFVDAASDKAGVFAHLKHSPIGGLSIERKLSELIKKHPRTEHSVLYQWRIGWSGELQTIHHLIDFI